MKLVVVLLVLVSSLLGVGQAAAESWSKRLTREKTSDEMYSFTIKVDRLKETDVGEFLQFHVTVKGLDLEELPHRSGELRVFNGKEFVSSSDVQPTGPAGKRSFSFRVAAKYAETSTFRYAQNGEFGHISYWFYLKDFVEPECAQPGLGEQDISADPVVSERPQQASTKPDQGLSDDERLKLLKPMMTLEEVKRLWQGKQLHGQACGLGVNKLTGKTGGAYWDVYLLQLSNSPRTQSMKFGFFQKEGEEGSLFEFQGPGFHYYLKDGKFVAVEGPPAKKKEDKEGEKDAP